MGTEITPETNRVTVSPLASAPESPRGQMPQMRARDERLPKGRAGFVALISLLVVALVTAVLFSLATGAVRISPGAILAALFGHRPLTATQQIILLQIRLPRVLASGVVGAALAISGLMFQGLFRNPMADPYVIGSSGGAVLGACLGIFFFSQLSLVGFSATALLAFAGSVMTIALLYSLGRSY